MEIVICNWISQRSSTVCYRVSREGEALELRIPESGQPMVVALDNWGPVRLARKPNGSLGWLAVRVSDEGTELRPLRPYRWVRVPYEFCTCRPFKGWVHYEYYPEAQLEGLRSLLLRLRAEHGAVAVRLMSSIDALRRDPHPQPELKRMLKGV